MLEMKKIPCHASALMDPMMDVNEPLPPLPLPLHIIRLLLFPQNPVTDDMSLE